MVRGSCEGGADGVNVGSAEGGSLELGMGMAALMEECSSFR